MVSILQDADILFGRLCREECRSKVADADRLQLSSKVLLDAAARSDEEHR